MIKIKNPVPKNLAEWFEEISNAYLDAKETLLLNPIDGEKITEDDLYHLAPSVCIKYRGIKRTENILKQATEIALSNYLANLDAHKKSLSDPYIAFALCYIVSHFALKIIDENQVESVMYYLDNMRNG